MNWVQVGTALLTPLIAIFGAYIAFQQWRINRANLKERLFERRMAIFQEAQEYLREFISNAKISNSSIAKFNLTQQKARFLFGKDIQTYLIEIRTRSIDVMRLEHEATQLHGEDKWAVTSKVVIELNWMEHQNDEIFEKFESYLGFGKHK